jgi:hypothetical protein
LDSVQKNLKGREARGYKDFTLLRKSQNWLWSMKITTHLHLVPRLRMLGALPPFLHTFRSWYLINERATLPLPKDMGHEYMSWVQLAVNKIDNRCL